MPSRPNVPCKHPGCFRLISYGTVYCEVHTLEHRSDVKTTKEKGYDNRWRKSRSRFLKRHPLCVRCLSEQKLVKATVVDHKIPHRGDKILFWNESNWQGLCKPCHDRKTMTEDRYIEYKYQ